jgi:hypothetical protein
MAARSLAIPRPEPLPLSLVSHSEAERRAFQEWRAIFRPAALVALACRFPALRVASTILAFRLTTP